MAGRLALCREQEEAVRHSVESPLIVLAGPGSGKTTVLVSRIEFMVEEARVNPKNILTLTFSNSAAKELRARVVLGGGVRLSVHTFHSFCWTLLLDCNLVTPFTSVYDEFCSLRLIKECLIEYRSTSGVDQPSIAGTQPKPRAILDAINKFKVNSTTTISLRKMNNLTPEQLEVLAVWELLEARKERNSAVDFNDMLLLAINVLRQSTATRSRYQKLYQYILVDEYQDTNSLQFDLLRLLVSSSSGRVTIVGDDDQSIYRWRGATLANWARFKETFPQHASVHLRVNFRSTPNIITACTGLISFNQSRLKKTLAPVICGTKKSIPIAVCLTSCQSSSTEAMHVAERIRRLVNDGLCNFRDIAVLFRSNPQGVTVKRLALSFKSMGIPYVTSQDVITSEGERNVVAALMLLVNPVDGVALSLLLQRVCGVKGHWNSHINLEQIITDNIPQGLTRHAGALHSFANVFKAWSEMCDSQATIKTLVDQIIGDIAAECDMSAFLTRAQLGGEGDMRAQIGELLHSVCLAPLCPEPKNAVTLSTIHRAKGLEWDTVFAIQLAENVNWGSKKSSSKHETDEERRVMYVCLSRAKQRLFLSYPNTANGGKTSPSRYVFEIKKRGGCIQKLKCAKGVYALARTLSIQTKQAAEHAAAVLAMKKLVGQTPRKQASSGEVLGTDPRHQKVSAKKATPRVKDKPDESTVAKKPQPGRPLADISRSQLLSLFETVRKSWQCLVCTFKNFPSTNRAFCGMCNAPKTHTQQGIEMKVDGEIPFSLLESGMRNDNGSSSSAKRALITAPLPSSFCYSSSSPISAAAASLRAVFDEADEEEKQNIQPEGIPQLETVSLSLLQQEKDPKNNQQAIAATSPSSFSPSFSSSASFSAPSLLPRSSASPPTAASFSSSLSSLPLLPSLGACPVSLMNRNVEPIFDASFVPKGSTKSRVMDSLHASNKRKAMKVEEENEEVEEITTKRNKTLAIISLLSHPSRKQEGSCEKENQDPNVSAVSYCPSSAPLSELNQHNTETSSSLSSTCFASAFPFSTSYSSLLSSLSAGSATISTLPKLETSSQKKDSFSFSISSLDFLLPLSSSPSSITSPLTPPLVPSSASKEVSISARSGVCTSPALPARTSASLVSTSSSVFVPPSSLRGGWLCSACTLENSAQAITCELCECQRAPDFTAPDQPLSPAPLSITLPTSSSDRPTFSKRSKFTSCLSQANSCASDVCSTSASCVFSTANFFGVKPSATHSSLLSRIIPDISVVKHNNHKLYVDEDDELASNYFRKRSDDKTKNQTQTMS